MNVHFKNISFFNDAHGISTTIKYNIKLKTTYCSISNFSIFRIVAFKRFSRYFLLNILFGDSLGR